MRPFIELAKAFADETRVRALLALRHGELCLCQLIDLLELAPSTVSKHLEVLHQVGLVERRKEGRWCYFRLADESTSTVVQQALRWALASLTDSPTIAADDHKLCCVRKKDLVELCACYKS